MGVFRPNAGIKWFSEINYVMGPDFIRKLAANQPVVADRDRLGTDWLARASTPFS
ncbi:MAG: hypothetical protein HY673_07315 [Chloroflexi bacterium]|nr:hypothetical protein [Chloroflexota bacterium]